MQNTDVTVIIVNWNGGQLLKECLNKIGLQTLIPKNIVVMDNGSTDGSIELLADMPNISIKRLNSNLGFAAANNMAIRDCETKYVALLNPDALAEPNWLECLVSAAIANPSIAVFGSKQIMLRNPELLDGLGDCYHFSGLVKRYGFGQPVKNFEGDNKLIFSACACAVMYDRDAFNQVGGFDEDYFCYVEDIDLGFRLRLIGYKALSVPSAVVYHFGSGTSGGNRSDFSIYYGHRNLVWTYFKNMPPLLFWILLPFHLSLNIYSIFYFGLRGKGKIILQSKWDAIKSLSKFWKKRKDIQSGRNVSVLEIWNVLEKDLDFGRKKIQLKKMDQLKLKSYFLENYFYGMGQKLINAELKAPVAVVIPCYCCTQTIRRAILSIAAQTLKPTEVILIDDASPDDTLEILRQIESEYGGWVKVIASQKNQGPGAARNLGWDLTSQPYIAFLDSDDAWHQQKIEIQYGYMRENSDIVLSGHQCRLLKDDDSFLNWKLEKFGIQFINQKQLLLSNRFVTPSIMVRADLNKRFHFDQRYMEDHRLWLEIASEGLPVVRLNVELAAVYKPMYGASGLSSNMWAMEKAEIKNYQYLYQQKKISFWSQIILLFFSVAKYIRRLLVVYFFRRLIYR